MTDIDTKTPIEVLGAYIADMPGGRYISDLWQREPREQVLVAVNGYDLARELIAAAYPPVETADGWLLFTVPETCARLLRWHADEDLHFIMDDELPDESSPVDTDGLVHRTVIVTEVLWQDPRDRVSELSMADVGYLVDEGHGLLESRTTVAEYPLGWDDANAAQLHAGSDVTFFTSPDQED